MDIGTKLSEAKRKVFEQYVESIYDHSNTPYKFIPLSQGKVAMVDAKHYDYLVRLCRWFYSTSGGYAVGNIKEDGRWKQKRMHRIIMSCPDLFEVDHINGDKLLNIESNLRICTRQENARNIPAFNNKEKSSKYKGVSHYKARNRWEVRIRIDGYMRRIGFFTNEIAAANAYNYFANAVYGEYASLNECPFMEEADWRSFNTGRQLFIENLDIPCINR